MGQNRKSRTLCGLIF